MSGPRRFDPVELGSDHDASLDEALEIARWLEAAADPTGGPTVSPSTGFGDRVMAAIADEPSPAPAGFLAPLHRRGLLGGFVASIRQAWRSMGGAGRPMLVRAPALAYVLVVVIAGTSIAGVATVGVAGALGVFKPAPTLTPTPLPVLPGPTLAPPETSPGLSEEPSAEPESPDPGESDDASGSPDGSDDHGGNSGPGSSGSGSGSDDNSGPGSSGSGSDDSSGSGSDDSGSGSGSTATPKPSATPRATGTPKPSETPH